MPNGSGERCGVAWNTLFLGLMTAASTTLLGTFMALMAERASRRYARPLRDCAAAHHHAAVCGGPGAHPAVWPGRVWSTSFWKSRLASATRWFYGWFGVWVAQTFAFTPIAFMIMRGVVQGVAPSLEEAAQTLRASPTRRS